nr:uncharacterized protein LOC111753058 [Loxodonta africana]
MSQRKGPFHLQKGWGAAVCQRIFSRLEMFWFGQGKHHRCCVDWTRKSRQLDKQLDRWAGHLQACPPSPDSDRQQQSGQPRDVGLLGGAVRGPAGPLSTNEPPLCTGCWKLLPKAHPGGQNSCGSGQESQSEPRALPPTEATGNLSEKAQVAGGQVWGPEADRLLTLEHSGSGTPAQAGDDAPATTTSHPCPIVELPPAWPVGCKAEDVSAFCFICFHREKEEELLEEIPLRSPRVTILPSPIVVRPLSCSEPSMALWLPWDEVDT